MSLVIRKVESVNRGGHCWRLGAMREAGRRWGRLGNNRRDEREAGDIRGGKGHQRRVGTLLEGRDIRGR